VRWVVAREIVTAWIITIPAAGLLAALFYWLSGLFG
jgi:PiT family inorganic phosphate transporter